jgi:hypothetical protein
VNLDASAKKRWVGTGFWKRYLGVVQEKSPHLEPDVVFLQGSFFMQLFSKKN